MAPFLAALVAIYFMLLTEYDINYYLKEKPPAFAVSVAIGGIIVATLVAVFFGCSRAGFSRCRSCCSKTSIHAKLFA